MLINSKGSTTGIRIGEEMGRPALTARIESSRVVGRLAKNLDFSKTESVLWSFCVLTLFSKTGRKTWSARCEASEGADECE